MSSLPQHQGAVKVHTLLDLRGSIPSFIHVSDGKLHDAHALALIALEPGAIYVMDRGYVDFARLHVLHLAAALAAAGRAQRHVPDPISTLRFLVPKAIAARLLRCPRCGIARRN